MITAAQLAQISTGGAKASNCASIADQLSYYTRTGLALLGFTPEAFAEFQRSTGGKLKVDGVAGPATRSLLHEARKALPVTGTPGPASNLASSGSHLRRLSDTSVRNQP